MPYKICISAFAIMLTMSGCNPHSAQSTQATHTQQTTETTRTQSNPQHELMQAMTTMQQQMDQVDQIYQDPDQRFAAGMIPHHMGALAMAYIELKYGQDPQMRHMAQQVIHAQQQEIDLLRGWLKTHAQPVSKQNVTSSVMHHQDMMQAMMNSNPDVTFAASMIPHHQMAIDMAQMQLKQGKDPTLTALSQKIIAAQTQEINQLKQWLDPHHAS